MLISHITPRNHLDLMNQGDFDFALAHVALDDELYCEYFAERTKRGRMCLLDNGVWETGEPMPVDTMIGLAIKLGATHIYAPDYLNRTDDTIDVVQKFCKIDFPCEFKSKIIAVAQGRTRDEWYHCVEELSKIVRVDTITIPALVIDDMFEWEDRYGPRMTKARLEFCHLLENNLEKFRGKHFYATGTGSPLCVRELQRYKWISAIDSTMACLLASQNRLVPDDIMYKPVEKLDFRIQFTESQLADAVCNIHVMNRWAHREVSVNG